MSEDELKEDRAWFFVITALSKFKQDIADGYFTRDRQYAIDMLGKAIEVRDAERAILASIPIPTGRADLLAKILPYMTQHSNDCMIQEKGHHCVCGLEALRREIDLALSSAPTQAVTMDDEAVERFLLHKHGATTLAAMRGAHTKDADKLSKQTRFAAKFERTRAALTAAFPQRPVADAPRYSYARSSGVWAVWDRSTTTCIKQCADENEAEKLCNKLNKQRREE